MQEIELKYKLNEDVSEESILEDSFVLGMVIPGTDEDIEMEAVYYDTPDRALSAKKVAFRVRKENDEFVATIKWRSKSREGLSIRNECNMEVSSEIPDLSVFRNDIDDSEILDLLDYGELEPIITTRYLRKKVALDYDGSVVELAVDRGAILAGGKTASISELEMELISGSTKTLLKLGRLFIERFGLAVEEKSKIKRGMELLGFETGIEDRFE